MYAPTHHRNDDRATQVELMRAHAFGALVTHGAAGLQATHLPILVADEGGALRLLAHMARANPQWRELTSGAEVLVIFAGPHAYISPRHYERAESVPTWNYAAVHAHGVPRLIEAAPAKHAMVEQLIALHDPDYLSRFASLSPEYLERMLNGIVAFAIDVVRLEARFKLSQEKLPVERERIVATLEASGDAAAVETARLMRRHEP
jgi:transcriptional regulator